MFILAAIRKNNFFFQGLVAPFLARTEVTYSSTICPRYMIMVMTMTSLRNMVMMMMHQAIPPAQNPFECWSRKLTIHILPLALINHDVLGICPNNLLLMNGTLTKRLHFQWYLGKPWKKNSFFSSGIFLNPLLKNRCKTLEVMVTFWIVMMINEL